MDVQTAPSVQATHVPLPLQTRSVPQVVPAVSGAAVSSQAGEPPVHDVVPATHGFGFVPQSAPALQGLHTPAPHTKSVPQLVPFASGTVVSRQDSTPVEQEVWKSVHSPKGVQFVPAVQETHEPALHTRFAPHTVPFGS